MKVKFTKPQTESFLGWGVKTVAAYRETANSIEVLCLVGESTAYQPLGGRKVLKDIIETTEEGKTYYWKGIGVG